MKRIYSILFFLSLSTVNAVAQDINSLSLQDAVTEKPFSLENEVNQKAFVLIFHSTSCPFVKMYEERIIDIRTRYQNQGIDFALVNSDPNPENQKASDLRKFIDESGLNMSYLMDINQDWIKFFHITKIPEVVIITPSSDGLITAYRGAIDNNAQAAGSVTEKYLERAINQILKGEQPSPGQVRAVGCNVRSF